jgi:hypothetical protein
VAGGRLLFFLGLLAAIAGMIVIAVTFAFQTAPSIAPVAPTLLTTGIMVAVAGVAFVFLGRMSG